MAHKEIMEETQDIIAQIDEIRLLKINITKILQ